MDGGEGMDDIDVFAAMSGKKKKESLTDLSKMILAVCC